MASRATASRGCSVCDWAAAVALTDGAEEAVGKQAPASHGCVEGGDERLEPPRDHHQKDGEGGLDDRRAPVLE